MDWSQLSTGIVLIVGITALGLYANTVQYRNAAKFRERRRKAQETINPHPHR